VIAAIAAVAVGLALVVAGAAKLSNVAAWRTQVAQLDVPAALAMPVPFAEVALGALLIAQLWRPVAAVAAVGLFTAFTALLVWHLRRGHRPPCACFGSWTSKPIGWHLVARNVALIALAFVASR
jgi:uncharacterized membrane protein YphA (DoxX/SURF4 family)